MKNVSYLYLTLSQCAIASNVVLGKFLIEEVPLFFYLGLRFFFSSIFLFIIFKLSKETLKNKKHKESKIHKREWKYLLLQALSAGLLFNTLFYWGIDYTTATSAGIISASLPGFIALLAYFILGEHLGIRKITALLIAMLGIALLNIDNTANIATPIHGSFLGDALILLSIIPEALYSIFTKKLRGKISPLGGAMLVNVFSFLMFFPLLLITIIQAKDFTVQTQHIGLLMLGGVCSVFFFWFWSKGLEGVLASTAALFGGIAPIVITVLAVLFLGEVFTIVDLGGMILVLCSLVLGSRNKLRTNEIS